MNREQLTEVIKDQMTMRWKESYIPRNAFSRIDSLKTISSVIIISGVRRCGKSTFLQQIRNSETKQDYYMNFDDERLINFSVEDFQKLYELFIEMYGEQQVFYFDEIQNIPGWERFVRRLHDQGNKLYITGSYASMLSRELGTHLTGRFVQIELYPFSFGEYLLNKKISHDIKFLGTKDKAVYKRNFNDYFVSGGIPEYIQSYERKYLKTMYESILYRDIVARYKITRDHELKELVYFCASNVSKEISYNSLKKIIGVNSQTTVKDYLSYLENAYLLFLLPRYDYSVKRQILAPKKIYIIDNALALQLGTRNSSDQGRLLENLVFIQLKRSEQEIYYYSGKRECDFVIKEGNRIIHAIQVTLSLENEETRQREINGLIEAMEAYGLATGLILTEDEEDEITVNTYKITILPVWKWLLQNWK